MKTNQFHQCKNRSEVISEALQRLQEKLLEAYYLEANQEINVDFEMTAADVLEDEQW